ncbi:MAG: efflux RND transporter periplasmic adaptor subunit, partial [Phycisphaeraceae bacterium]
SAIVRALQTKLEGKVIAMPVREGDSVEAGRTVLVRIDDVWARQDLAAAKAEVAAAQAQLDQARRDLAQLEELEAAGSAKPREVADARAQVASNRATLEAAVARHERAEQRVNRLEVVAPFDGVIIRELTEVGQWLSPGAAVAELISRGEVDAVINVPERLIDHVRPGETVKVRIDPLSTTVEGEVVAVTPYAGNAARTFPVKIRLDDRDGRLKPGMSVTAQLPLTQSEDRLTVPRDAIVRGPAGTVVWTAQEGGGETPVAAPVSVEVLFARQDRYAVEPEGSPTGATLEPGTRVVTQGAERLQPGQPLQEGQMQGHAGPADPEGPTEASGETGAPTAPQTNEQTG